MLRIPFRGGRIIKTGIAVFLTAWIVGALNWPIAFAVITAIVTIEPTVNDSIKKGLVRFPASAIGAFYTVTFVSLFGHTPLTYTLSAVFTIATTYRLNLHAGLLVATLTAVAMVDVVHTNLLIAFIVRLGTTTIGLLVSTFVNMFILPPSYAQEINKKFTQIKEQFVSLVDQVPALFMPETAASTKYAKDWTTLKNTLALTQSLIQFEEKDANHPFVSKDDFPLIQKQEQLSRYFALLDSLEQLEKRAYPLREEDLDILKGMTKWLGEQLLHPTHAEAFETKKSEWTTTLRASLCAMQGTDQMTDRTLVHYELLRMLEHLQAEVALQQN